MQEPGASFFTDERPPLLGTYGLAAFFFFQFLWLELTFRMMTHGLWGIGLLFSVLFAAAGALGLSYFCRRASPRINTVLCFAVLAFFSTLYAAQVVYYHFSNTYFTVFSAANGGMILEFMDNIKFSILQNLHRIFVCFVPIVAFILVRRRLDLSRGGLRGALRRGLAALGAHAVCVAMLLVGGTGSLSPFGLYFNTISLDHSIERLGVLTAMRIDLERLLVHFEPKVELSEPVSEQETPEDTQPNTLPIDFAALASQAAGGTTLQQMHHYFAGVTPTYQNEHSGIWQGKNLVWVVAESFSPWFISPELTPTLYKLSTEGYQFKNFYVPLWGLSTSDGEYATLTGLFPKAGTWSMSESYDNALPFTAGNALRAEGYACRAYHDHTYTYYNRQRSHPNLGYDYKGIGNGLMMRAQWPRSDREMVDVTTGEYMNDPPFHTYYLTVSGHMIYEFGGNSMAFQNRALVEDLPYSDEARAYIAGNLELERALALLMERLEQAGQLSDTVIVLSADHYPYGLPDEVISEMAGYEVDTDLERFHSTLILYKHGMTPEVVEKPCSSVDILPTVLNLLGVPYDSRLLMGRDIFSDAPPLVVFCDQSWLTDRAYFNSTDETVTVFGDEPLPDGYAEEMDSIVKARLTYSGLILDLDYYRALGIN